MSDSEKEKSIGEITIENNGKGLQIAIERLENRPSDLDNSSFISIHFNLNVPLMTMYMPFGPFPIWKRCHQCLYTVYMPYATEFSIIGMDIFDIDHHYKPSPCFRCYSCTNH